MPRIGEKEVQVLIDAFDLSEIERAASIIVEHFKNQGIDVTVTDSEILIGLN
jgi:hypothetical protein